MKIVSSNRWNIFQPKEKIMKLLALTIVLMVSNVWAANTSINKISIKRSGGGQITATASLNAAGEVEVITESCNYKKLSGDEKLSTIVTLAGDTAEAAIAVLNNKAILASDESIKPMLATGSWVSLEVIYSTTVFNGSVLAQEKEIPKPLVVIDGSLSNVLADIETTARKASIEVCR